MAAEILKRDANSVTVLGGVTDDANLEVRNLLVDATTGRLKVSGTITSAPAGSDTQVQFNDAGTTAGDAGFTYNKTTDSVTLAGGLTVLTVNKVTVTAPATSATLTIANGKTLTASNTLTFTGTDSSSVAFGAGGTVAYVANKLSVFAATTSAELAGVISDETGSGSLVFGTSPTISTPVFTNGAISFSGPQGYMVNGKITATVASNNLTVALKGLDGNNPSATNPVYINIGGTVRTITAALSVTKNAGTNWFNSGSTDLATFDVDYFVYLGYNATDGVVLGFSRLPYARTYGDFSATTTNDRYAAISTITTANSTDAYENIGRFNATLSATASFNWSIGTAVIVNQPCFTTRWLTYSPTTAFTAGVAPATLDTTNSCARYILIGEECVVNLFRLYSSAGTTVTRCDLNLPFPNRNGAALLVSGTGSTGAGLTPVLCQFQQVNTNAIGNFCSSSSADRFSVSCYYPY